MSTTSTDVVLRYYAAINARDWAAYDELFTSDAELYATGSETMTGIPAVKAFDQAYVSSFPDLHIDSVVHIAGPDGTAGTGTVASENVATATMLGPLPTPYGVLPPTGEHGTLRYAGLFTVSDGRISSQRIYLDRLAVLELTKAMPA